MNNPRGNPTQLPEGMIAIPPGQEGFFLCECGSKSFSFDDSFNVIFDRINPRHSGMIPESRILVCRTCRKEIPADENLEIQIRNQARNIVEP